MEFCENHWDTLKSAVRLHGMWDLQVHDQDDIAQLLRNINGEFSEEDNPELFDALLASQLYLFEQALRIGGLHPLLQAGHTDGEFCVLCKCHAGGHDVAQWVEHACTQVKEHAVEQGRLKETKH